MANKPEIIDVIEGLTVHCRPPIMEASARASWLADWCSDLADFPIESIRLAVRDWRHSASGKFPTPGQLLPLVRSKLPIESKGRPQDWAPLSDDEYRALPIRDKIRHQLILAHEAGCKAGPMWRNPEGGGKMSRPVDGRLMPEDMPPTHRHWTEVRASHMAEVKRLREIIDRAEERGAA